MARIMFDGFEKYGNIGTTIFSGSPVFGSDAFTALSAEWVATTGDLGLDTATIVAGAISPCAIQLTTAAAITKTLPTSYSTLIFGFRMFSDGGNPSGITLIDGGTAQVTVQVNTSGAIEVRRGGSTGTLLGTSTQTVLPNTWHYYEGSITINSTTGAFTIKLDGAATSLAATSQNTQVSANASANTVSLFENGVSGNKSQFDDFYLFDNTGSANNTMIGDSVVMPIKPVSDNAVQFSNGQGLIGSWWNGGGTSRGFGTGKILLCKVVPSVNCTLSAVVLVPGTTDNSATLQPVVYQDSSGTPTNLLQGGSQVTGITAVTPLIMPLTTAIALTAGTTYWLGTFCNFSGTDVLTLAYPASGDPTQGRFANVTYGVSPPSTAPGLTTDSTYSIGGIVHAAINAFDVGYAPPSVNSFNNSSTPGNADLYNTAGLSNNPNLIASVKLSMWAYKSDTNTRTMDLQIKSGSTISKGSASGFVLSTSPAYFDSYFDTDPNTGLGWTTTGVNNAKIGCDIAT